MRKREKKFPAGDQFGRGVNWQLDYDLAGQTLALAKAFEQWQPNPNGGGGCDPVRGGG